MRRRNGQLRNVNCRLACRRRFPSAKAAASLVIDLLIDSGQANLITTYAMGEGPIWATVSKPCRVCAGKPRSCKLLGRFCFKLPPAGTVIALWSYMAQAWKRITRYAGWFARGAWLLLREKLEWVNCAPVIRGAPTAR